MALIPKSGALVEGPVVNLRGRAITLPPLLLEDYLRLLPKIAALATGTPDLEAESCRTMREVIWAALRTNYPDVQEADLAELIDVQNLRPTYLAVMNATSAEKPPGEAKAP